MEVKLNKKLKIRGNKLKLFIRKLTMVLHQKAINAILNLSSQERCEHTLKRIADSGVLYVLADEEGDWILWGDEKNSS